MTEKIFFIKVIPNSKTNCLVVEAQNFLKIKLTAPAVENKANKALISFLAKHFKIAKSQITIIKGLKSSTKQIKIYL